MTIATETTTTKFAGETPEQIKAHQRIARRHSRLRRRYDNGVPLPLRLRIAELERFFVDTYGGRRLPDDDAGRDDLRLMLDHLAQIDADCCRAWIARWCPFLADAEIEKAIARAGIGRRWKADALARELGLTDATRTKLKIKTIGAVDCNKAQRLARRRRKRILADRARRAAAGAKPRAKSAENLMPWIEKKISRATWYRQRAKETVETNARPIRRSRLDGNRGESHEAPGASTEASSNIPRCRTVSQRPDQHSTRQASSFLDPQRQTA